MSMKSIWITGARGFIGRYLARQLSTSGCRVSGIGHGAWTEGESAHWGVSYWMNGEISSINLGQMSESVGPPEVVFHLAGGSSVGAAVSNPYEDFTRTVVSTADLLEWLRQYGPKVRVIAVSSAAVYGSGHDGIISEEARLSPFSPYGTHKLMMEELCRSYAANFGLKIVLPRLFSVYGPGLKKQLLWDLCNKIASNKTIELGGTGDERRDWTDVRDVAKGLEKLESLANADAPVINLATGIGTNVREIATILTEKWCAAGGSPKHVKFSGRSRPGDPFSLVADIQKMRDMSIEQCIRINQGIAEYVKWFRSQMGQTT